MFWRLLLLEKDKAAGRLFFWMELGILALIIVIIDMFEYLVVTAPISTSPTQKQQLLHQVIWPQALAGSIQFGALGNILLIIAIAILTSQEYTWRTFHLWLSRGVSRIALMVAKSVLILLLAMWLVLTTVVVGAIITGILTLILKGSLPFSQIQGSTLLLSFLVSALGLLPYAALTFMLTILFRNTAASMGIALTVLLVIENVLHIMLASINATTAMVVNYLPSQLASSLSNAVLASGPAHGNTPSPFAACMGLIVYTAIFAGIGIWAFSRQDLSE